jgi:hypothetical protein
MKHEIPYPKSDCIQGIRWLTEPLLYPNSHGDVWAGTWADDGEVYAASDDTTGIDKAANSNLAINKISGTPPNHTAVTINPMREYGHPGWRDGLDTWKANGLVCVDGVLYLGVSQHSSAYDYPDNLQRVYDGSIVKSVDHGQTWSVKPAFGQPMFLGPRFGTPFFVQFGQDYAGAFDEYVYAVSNGCYWNNGNYMNMARVRRDRIANLDPADWEFFTGANKNNEADWVKTAIEAQRNGKGGIFKFRGQTSMTGIQYVPAVDRFILAQWAYTHPDDPRPWDQTSLYLFEAPKPWGPWKWFHVEENWGVSFYNPCLPSKWFEDGGMRMWMTAAGNFQQTPGAPFAYGLHLQKLELLT